MKKTVLKILCLGLALCVLLSFSACQSNTSYQKQLKDIVWSDLELGEHLPEFENAYGEIGTNLDHALILTLHNVDKNQFNAYKEKCINAGYTIESEDTGTSYIAFNAVGYETRLILSDTTLYIHLDAPEELEIFEWPNSGLGTMLPAPASNLGDISWNNSETFIARIGNTSIDDYAVYVNMCENSGFLVDFSKEEKFYSAKNIDGYKLTLRYLGFNIIEISLKAPDDAVNTNDTTNENEEPAEPDTNDEDTSDEMRDDFINAMDSYEAFINDYVDLVKQYLENPTDMGLLSEYTDYMNSYADMMETFENWEDEDLSAAELAYYLEVQARVSQKLLEIA